jgi:hypothetical protein
LYRAINLRLNVLRNFEDLLRENGTMKACLSGDAIARNG